MKFLSRGLGYTIFLKPTETVMVLSKPQPKQEPDVRTARSQQPQQKSKSTVLSMKLLGANPKAQMTGKATLTGKVNYLNGKDASQWRKNISTYGKVRAQSVYPGIDLVYYGNQRQLEYDFIVAPGANPNQIQFQINGADKVEINQQGDLVLKTALGEVKQHKPILYQEIAGKRQSVSGHFVLGQNNTVSFAIGNYDSSRLLVIDPILSYLAFSTYLGGLGDDFGNSIAVDRSGNVYVTGHTTPFDLPFPLGKISQFPMQNAFDSSFNGRGDVFVTKLNTAGVLVYSTYLGGSSEDNGYGIAVDSSGNAYVTGEIDSTNFPTANARDSSFNGTSDAFVTKVSVLFFF